MTEEDDLRECVDEGVLSVTVEEILRELVKNCCPETEEDDLRVCVGEW